MNELTVGFSHKDIRTVVDDKGKTWFVAKDVCDALGIANSRNVVAKLDDDEKGNAQMLDATGRQQEMNIISESGLYTLIVSMNPSRARAKELRNMLFNSISSARDILDALNNFEVPDDLDDMFLYAIREVDTGNIKLGISRDPEARLKQLATGNSSELELVLTKPARNRFKDERALHQDAATLRIRGEWFAPEALKLVA